MKTVNFGNGLKVRDHKGDAMTLLAFDLAQSKSANFTGFTVRIARSTPYSPSRSTAGCMCRRRFIN